MHTQESLARARRLAAQQAEKHASSSNGEAINGEVCVLAVLSQDLYTFVRMCLCGARDIFWQNRAVAASSCFLLPAISMPI